MKDAERFAVSISKIEGRLTYKSLISKPDFTKGGEDIESMMEE